MTFRSSLGILCAVLWLPSCATRALPAPEATPLPPPSGIYERRDWPHWSDEDRDCLDTRAEVLVARSERPVKLAPKGCTVVEGLWSDYYYPEKHRRAADVDIDHLVPLKHAHESGGAGWSRERKRRFANDPRNLVITQRRYNRSKGAKTPLEWLPRDRAYACRYLKDWLALKSAYGLRVAAAERGAVEGCGGIPLPP